MYHAGFMTINLNCHQSNLTGELITETAKPDTGTAIPVALSCTASGGILGAAATCSAPFNAGDPNACWSALHGPTPHRTAPPQEEEAAAAVVSV